MDDIRREVVKFLTEYALVSLVATIILLVGALRLRWLGRATDEWLKQKTS